MNYLFADIVLQRIASYADSLFLLCAGTWAIYFYPKKQAKDLAQSGASSAESEQKRRNVRLVKNCGALMIVLTVVQLALKVFGAR